MALMFFPRGGSSQVVRYLSRFLPDTGWVSCWMEGPGDAAGVIELFRLQYDRYTNAAL